MKNSNKTFFKKKAFVIMPYTICLAFLFTLLSCKSDLILTPKQYMDYFEKHRSEYTKTIERNGVKAIVAYLPSEYYAARDLESDSTLSFKSTIKKYENSLFFVFSVTGEKYQGGSILLERQGMAGFKESVDRNTFERGQDIFLLKGSDTVRTAGYHYDRNWGFGSDDSFLLAFSKNSLKSRPESYHLIIREMTPELGTVDIAVKDLMKQNKRLKG
jgi:hypothetical protein